MSGGTTHYRYNKKGQRIKVDDRYLPHFKKHPYKFAPTPQVVAPGISFDKEGNIIKDGSNI